MTKPLRSTTITVVSTLLRACLPLGDASILLALRVCACTVLLSSSPQVPAIQRESPDQAHATSMPGAVWSVNRFPPNLSQSNENSLVLTPSTNFGTCTVVHLCSPSWSTPDIFEMPFP
ncbi:hypothetical protein [Chroococcidiopsis sp. CCMEE 29]|uniref:hypothetical protein n=1 Tax=Chroococcidiopsis sp. CCMEE 29 TaxID=155894 RepID=UPI002020C7D1|nr:hypothetical protein [Chroococcidiopsis sp. CCMEE 29]